MKNALEVSHLTKDYGSFKLDDVSFTVPGGTIMGLIGENGAGKSTTIKCILNLVRRDGGEIQVLGLDNLADERAVKAQVGWCWTRPPSTTASPPPSGEHSRPPLPRLGWSPVPALPGEIRPHQQKAGQDLLQGHEDEAVPRGGLCR